MIRFDNVDVSFNDGKTPVHAVKNVSFEIKENDIFGIAGGSGAGKSTLLRTINQLQKISGGSVTVNGKEVKDFKHKELHELRRNIGMIFQHFNLAESKTVFENIAFSLEDAGWKKSDIETYEKSFKEYQKLNRLLLPSFGGKI